MNQKKNQELKQKKIHFIGIGGIGMSALARYYHQLGALVSGSDKESSYLINDLINEKITTLWSPHNKNKIESINPDIVVYSTAITATNEELIWAKENNKTILHRSDLLQIATQDKKLISISGTHGKTTTSAMVAELLINSNFNPSAILGGILISKNTNIIFGSGEYFVIEADESDKSFLKGEPEITIITNIEADHLENYPGGLDEIKKSFVEFASKGLSKKGLVACLDDKNTREIINANFKTTDPKLITYSINNSGASTINANFNLNTKSWDVFLKDKYFISLQLQIPGRHNVLNALAATGVGYLLGISPNKIKESLEKYSGVKRRFQILSTSNNITIVDDYAHHPTEIAATIHAAKEMKPKRLLVILQPHQPTRLKDLWSDFIKVLRNEDVDIFITDTYIARGSAIEGINSKQLVGKINKPNVNYLSGSIDEIALYIRNIIKSGDLVLILGAGDITNLGYKLIKFTEMLASKSGNN